MRNYTVYSTLRKELEAEKFSLRQCDYDRVCKDAYMEAYEDCINDLRRERDKARSRLYSKLKRANEANDEAEAEVLYMNQMVLMDEVGKMINNLKSNMGEK